LGENDLYVPLSRGAYYQALEDPNYITEEDILAIRAALGKEEKDDSAPDTFGL